MTRTKHASIAAQFRRLTTRLGKRHALVAVGHRILVMAWHVLPKHASYQELGSADGEQCDAQAYRLKRIRTLEALGLKVAVEPATSVSEASISFSIRVELRVCLEGVSKQVGISYSDGHEYMTTVSDRSQRSRAIKNEP